MPPNWLASSSWRLSAVRQSGAPSDSSTARGSCSLSKRTLCFPCRQPSTPRHHRTQQVLSDARLHQNRHLQRFSLLRMTASRLCIWRRPLPAAPPAASACCHSNSCALLLHFTISLNLLLCWEHLVRHEEQQHRLSNKQRMSHQLSRCRMLPFQHMRGEKVSHIVECFHSANVPLVL